jgi:hypothetical protein
MKNRASNIAKIFAMFKLVNRINIFDIANALGVTEVEATDYCKDLIISSLLTISYNNDNVAVYSATEKIVSMDTHIYDIIGELNDEVAQLEIINKENSQKSDVKCIFSIGGWCQYRMEKYIVGCNGIDDKARCFKWKNM